MSIRDGGHSSPFTRARPLALVLAAALALAIAMPQTTQAQQFAQAQTSPKAGTWTPTKRGIDRAKEIGGDVRKAVTKFYGDSPNLQILEGMIENVVLDKLPLAGDAFGIVKDAPDEVKAGLTVWLQKKKNNAAIAEDFDRMDRYDAFLSCLYGDCSGFQRAGTGAAPPIAHSGQPEQLKIKSAVVLVPQIQQGETTRVTVSVQTIIGGDVTIELQSPGNAIGPVRYTIKTKPGETVSRNFDQFFPAAGNFRLLVLAKDARSDDSARAYVVVTEKVKFDGHYTGTIAIQAKAGNRIEPMSFVLDFVVKDNKVAGQTGVAHAASEKSAPLKSSANVSSKIAGEVDDKGNLTATWSYRDEAREPSGAIYASILGAPLTGSIKDGVVQGAFSCESKVFKNDIAARDPKGDRSSAAIGTRLFSGAFKGASGAWTARRAK